MISTGLEVNKKGKVVGVIVSGASKPELRVIVEAAERYLEPCTVSEKIVEGKFAGLILKFKGDKDGAIAKASTGHLEAAIGEV